MATRHPRGKACRTLPTGLFFDLGFVDQHHRYVIPDGIHAMTLNTLQSALIRLHLNSGLADWANQDFQQILIDGHNELLSLASGGLSVRRAPRQMPPEYTNARVCPYQSSFKPNWICREVVAV
jgi:hypothetical protein